MSTIKIIFLIGGVLLLFLAWKAYTTFFTAPERAYTIEQNSNNFEVRSYEQSTFAQTTKEGSYAEVMSKGFLELAAYIFAKNRNGEKIAMTAPVLFAPKGNECWDIRFVLPPQYTSQNAPSPVTSKVDLHDAKACRIAVRFVSGAPTWSQWQKEEKILREQIAQHNLSVSGRSWYARYNPPWIPSFLRRNEIMIEVK